MQGQYRETRHLRPDRNAPSIDLTQLLRVVGNDFPTPSNRELLQPIRERSKLYTEWILPVRNAGMNRWRIVYRRYRGEVRTRPQPAKMV